MHECLLANFVTEQYVYYDKYCNTHVVKTDFELIFLNKFALVKNFGLQKKTGTTIYSCCSVEIANSCMFCEGTENYCKQNFICMCENFVRFARVSWSRVFLTTNQSLSGSGPTITRVSNHSTWSSTQIL